MHIIGEKSKKIIEAMSQYNLILIKIITYLIQIRT
jgi:hypothetical protein